MKIDVTKYRINQLLSWLPPLVMEIDERLSPEAIGPEMQTFADLGGFDDDTVCTEIVQRKYGVVKNPFGQPSEFDLEAFEAQAGAVSSTREQFHAICSAIYDKCRCELLTDDSVKLFPAELKKLTQDKDELALIRRIIRLEFAKRMKVMLTGAFEGNEVSESQTRELKEMACLTVKSTDSWVQNRVLVDGFTQIARSGNKLEIKSLIDNFFTDQLLDRFESVILHAIKPAD